MCAYICACAHSWLQVWVHTWRSEDNPKCPSSPSTLFELCSLGCWLLWSMGLWGLLWLCLPSSYNSPRITAVRTTMSALHGFWRVKLRSSNVCGKCSSSQVSSQALNLFHWFFDTIINEIVVWISFSDSILSMSPVFEYHKSSYYKYLYINFWVNICFHFSRVNTQ